jgi:hypothetical protein
VHVNALIVGALVIVVLDVAAGAVRDGTVHELLAWIAGASTRPRATRRRAWRESWHRRDW